MKTLFIEENSSVESVDPDGCLTPFPPVLSENGDHFLLEFQNGEKYIILSSEDAEFLKKFIEKFDQLYTLQNQMIRNDFNTTYDFACKTASKLKITIEKPSHKKSEKAIASDFWTKQVTKYLDYLIDEGKRAEVILSKLKTENKFLKENRSSANPRKNLKYPLGDSEILIEFQEFINASVEECIDTAGAINKPNLELSRLNYEYEYLNYVIRFSSGLVLGHPQTKSVDAHYLEADELFELEKAMNKFHVFYSGFITLKSDLNEATYNPSTIELKLYPNENTRPFLYLQDNLDKYSKMFSLNLVGKNSLINFWITLLKEIKDFIPKQEKARKTYLKFDKVLKKADESDDFENEYPLFDLKVLASLKIFAENQINKLQDL